MPSERYPNINVAGDPQPRDVPFRFGVEKPRDSSPDVPARVRGSFEDRSSAGRTVGFGPIQPFSNVWSEEDCPPVLVPTDREVQRYAPGTDEQVIPDRPVEGCWRTDLVRLVRRDVLGWQSLDAGGRIRTEYAVLQYPERETMEATMCEWFGPGSERDGCLPAGEYRFEEPFPPKRGTDTSWEEFTAGSR